jgi:hypothetical protein
MDELRFVAERANERFEIIEGDSGEGFYVVRYVDGTSTHDYLQDVIAMAHRCAKSQWGLESSSWREAMPGELPLGQQQSDS